MLVSEVLHSYERAGGVPWGDYLCAGVRTPYGRHAAAGIVEVVLH